MTTTAFEIGGNPLGEGHPVFVVAELPLGPPTSRDIAFRTIEAAAKLGANAVKIETCSPAAAKPESAGTVAPWEWHADLKACADAAGIPLLATPFDAVAAELLDEIDVAGHGIASFDIVDLPLIEHVARRGRPMLLSTDMASLGEIEAAVATCRASGNSRIALLRGALPSPARPNHLNKRGFDVLSAFATVVGLSDRTSDATAAMTAVALGAKIIEKRFVLERARCGPAGQAALEPSELEALVKSVRAAERALGSPRFGPSEEERGDVRFRRSLYVVRDVGVSAVLTADDVQTVRTSDGIAPAYLPAVLGRRATRAVLTGAAVTWDLVGPAPERPFVELKAATMDDRGALLLWRNEPRRMRGSEMPIAEADHREWLERSLRRSDRAIFLAWQDVTRVGMVRLDQDGGAWEVNIVVAPEARGKRLSTSILVGLEVVARARGVRTLTARIRPDSVTSLAAFKRAGYYAFVERVVDGEKWLFCERRIVPFGAIR